MTTATVWPSCTRSGRAGGALEQEANRGLTAAEAQWGRFAAVGSSQHGHCLCVVEEQ